ncbi:MAG: helix-turn-helix domain-containing protein [Streptosporangiaceae bacterium]
MDEIRAGGYSPTIRKRSLSRKLVELRKACGLTTTDVQRQLGWSATKLNWIEKAKWLKPSSDAVVDLCELYGVEGAARDALIGLAREGRQRGWWRKYNDVFSSELPGFEAGAATIATFETAFIPGLLQVPAYIELAARAAGIEGPAEIQRRVDSRLQRQQILTRDTSPCLLHAIVDENAIARITGPAIRRAQLTHLAEITSRPNVDLQLLPFAAGLYPAAGEAFAYLTFPDPSERDIVHLETAIDNRMLEEPDELERYKLQFEKLRATALTPDETRTYLTQQIG